MQNIFSFFALGLVTSEAWSCLFTFPLVLHVCCIAMLMGGLRVLRHCILMGIYIKNNVIICLLFLI